jgi:hypothetical protein
MSVIRVEGRARPKKRATHACIAADDSAPNMKVATPIAISCVVILVSFPHFVGHNPIFCIGSPSRQNEYRVARIPLLIFHNANDLPVAEQVQQLDHFVEDNSLAAARAYNKATVNTELDCFVVIRPCIIFYRAQCDRRAMQPGSHLVAMCYYSTRLVNQEIERRGGYSLRKYRSEYLL